MSLVSGTLAGFVLAAVQHFTVVPLIEAAETYETSALQDKSGAAEEPKEQAWRPADGGQRISLTVLTPILTGIGLAAMLFGAVAFTGRSIDAATGALWGLAGFACFGLAPALGLPPQPPGVAVAAVPIRQLWWIATAMATAAGLGLMSWQRRNWMLRACGVVCLLLPHVVGAPVSTGDHSIPAWLLHQFTVASLATTAMFWLLLGTIGGFLFDRSEVG